MLQLSTKYLFLGLSPRKILKKGIVPTLNLPKMHDTGISNGEERYFKRKRRQGKDK